MNSTTLLESPQNSFSEKHIYNYAHLLYHSGIAGLKRRLVLENNNTFGREMARKVRLSNIKKRSTQL